MLHKGRFVIEDWFGPFEGWTMDQRWKGWACPYFEFDTARQMVEAWNCSAFSDEAYQARYDEEQDAFCFRDGGLEEWDCFGSKILEIKGVHIKAYPIGAFCWTWSDAEPPSAC